MNDIRPLEPSDVPQIVALRRRVFRHSGHAADASLETYYRTAFLENPWRNDNLPSLVLTSGNEIQGFLGVIPRPATLGAERLTAVTTTEFMVAPEVRGVSGVSLMRRVFDAGQDISYSDRCNEQARGMYEAMGGSLAPWYCSYWTAPLDGSRVTFDRGPSTGPLRGIPARTLRRVARSMDRLDARLGARPFAARPSATQDAPLALDTVVNLVSKAAGPNALAPVYDTNSLAWVLERLGDRHASERSVRVQVTREGAVIGWFIYQLRPDGEAIVVQLAALRGSERAVFDHLLYHATNAGASLVQGRCDRKFASAISELGLPLTLGQPWTVVRSRRPDLMLQLLSGAAFFSRLESEWWLSS